MRSGRKALSALVAAVSALLLLAGCGDIPRDPEGTADRVRATGTIRVGVVSGALPRDIEVTRRVMRRLSHKTRSKVLVTAGLLEPLFLLLEHGDLDLVVGGRFDQKTPWVSRVALGPAFHRDTTNGITTEARIAARNGENGWITMVEREARAVTAQ